MDAQQKLQKKASRLFDDLEDFLAECDYFDRVDDYIDENDFNVLMEAYDCLGEIARLLKQY